LLVAYFFPPNWTGGVLRTVKFVKYLAELGWKSTVIAPDWGRVVKRVDDVGFDASLPPDTEVIHAGIAGDDDWLWKMLHQVPKFWRVEPALREAFQYPDRFARWGKDALPKAREALTLTEHHVVYSTSPPITSHHVALRLKRELGLPWVADFRDPFTDNVLAYGTPPNWRRRIDRRLEHQIYREADRIVANTETNRTVLVEKHQVTPGKVVTITNGYDEAEFAETPGRPPSDRFRITYCGSFYSTYNPTAFLAALKRFLARKSDARLTLTLAGDACRWARENIHDTELLSVLELLGHIPHREVCRLLTSSHLLLHTYPPGIPYSVPGKLYEYLRSGSPIVAICDRPSEVATLLERTGRGRAFRADELDALTEYLVATYEQWATQGDLSPARPPDETIRPYDRAVLTKRLADIFETVAEEAEARRRVT
jgi:glycosyltransferase involved in cell wall biosynthesis